MTTIGLDLASQPAGTAAILVEWGDEGGLVRADGVIERLADEQIVDLIRSNPDARVGIDAPFGWPVKFGKAIAEWQQGGRWIGGRELPPLRYRVTDIYVHEQTGRVPLSVSTDLISICAFRCARLLTLLVDGGEAVRVGGRIIEVYPAAALNLWGLTSPRIQRVKDDGSGSPREAHRGLRADRPAHDRARTPDCMSQERSLLGCTGLRPRRSSSKRRPHQGAFP